MNRTSSIVFVFIFLLMCTSSSWGVELMIQELTANDSDDLYPQVSGAYAVWEWQDPNGDTEIMFYDSKNLLRLTDNATDDIMPQLYGKRAVWQGQDPLDGDWEIFYFDGYATRQLTNDAYDDENPKISDSVIIWQGWDGNDWEIETAAIPAAAGIKVTPQSLNLKSRGRWITVHLKLPEGMTASQVDKTSLLLMDQVPVDKVQKGKGARNLTLKFERADVTALLAPGPEVVIYLAGQMKDGTVFDASDTIKVIDPGQ